MQESCETAEGSSLKVPAGYQINVGIEGNCTSALGKGNPGSIWKPLAATHFPPSPNMSGVVTSDPALANHSPGSLETRESREEPADMLADPIGERRAGYLAKRGRVYSMDDALD